MGFKIGDIVVCKSGYNRSDIGYGHGIGGGYGYVDGLVFTITSIADGGGTNTIWYLNSHGLEMGCWEHAVELNRSIEPLKRKIKFNFV